MSHLPKTFVTLAVCLAAMPMAAGAQTIPYGGGSGSSGGSYGGSTYGGDSGQSGGASRSRGGERAGDRRGVQITPYIEAAQVATAELSPGSEVLTYSRLAAGIDASIQGRNTGLAASVRYEHYFGWGKNAQDGDVVSGLARGYATVVPGVQIEAGGMAARARITGSGGVSLGPVGGGADTSNIYSAYAGPTIKTQVGRMDVEGGYRIGYSRVESPDALVTAPGQTPVDVFDDSVTHNASLRVGVAPNELGVPVGVGVGGNYYREDISNFDQRIEDKSVRGDVTVQVTPELALVGGIGYEDVTISSRDALIDPVTGLPVIGSDGRTKTDKSGPRQIALDTSGLIWDAGVLWRPSDRTSFEAHVGKRYGSTTYYGSLGYKPSANSNISISVYDNVSGYGGQLSRALADLPSDFEVNRDVLSGDITGCVASTEGDGCLAGALGSVRSSTFRARGVQASYGAQLGRVSAGIGAGYDRRKFIAAPGTILATANGVIDENIWLASYVNAKLSQRGSLSATARVNWLKTDEALAGDTKTVSASAAYGHRFTDHLTATAAIGVDGEMRDDTLLDDLWSASALVGVRYSF